MKKFGEDSGSQRVLSELLRRHVGHGQLYTVEEFAALCGLTESAVYAARLGNVGLETTRIILDNLPPECWTEFLSHWGFPQAVRSTEAGGDHHEAGRWAAGFTHEYVEAAADGHITHVEAAKLRRWYYRGMSVLSRLTAGAVRS